MPQTGFPTANGFVASALRGQQPFWPDESTPEFAAEVENIIYSQAMASVLYHQYQSREAWQSWPEELRSKINRTALYDAGQMIMVEAQISQLLDAFARERIPLLLLKGAALAFGHYQHPAMRNMADIDILFRRRDLHRALPILESLGYQFIYRQGFLGQEFLYHKTGARGTLPLDLHWRISSYVLLAHVLDFEQMWHSADKLPEIGEQPCILSSVHALLHACVHLVKHQACGDPIRMAWLVDIRLLCEGLDEAQRLQFIELCRVKKITRIAGVALEHVAQTFPERSIEALAETLKTINQDEPSARLLGGDTRSFILADVLSAGSGKALWRSLQDVLFPPTAYVSKFYGRRERWALPWLYLRRLGEGAVEYSRRRN